MNKAERSQPPTPDVRQAARPEAENDGSRESVWLDSVTSTGGCPAVDLLRAVPRQRRSQQSDEMLLARASELIAEQHQVSFTVDEFQNAAGTAIGRLYYWFTDLDHLVFVLAERIRADAEELLATGAPGVETLLAVANRWPALAVLAVAGPPAPVRVTAIETIHRLTGLQSDDPSAASTVFAIAGVLANCDLLDNRNVTRLIELLVRSADSYVDTA